MARLLSTLGALFLTLTVNLALACSCVPTDLLTNYKSASSVFSGKVVEVKDGHVKFIVLKTWKGPNLKFRTVSSPGIFNCDYPFVVGHKYLVYGNGNLCDGTKELSSASMDLEFFARYKTYMSDAEARALEKSLETDRGRSQ